MADRPKGPRPGGRKPARRAPPGPFGRPGEHGRPSSHDRPGEHGRPSGDDRPRPGPGGTPQDRPGPRPTGPTYRGHRPGTGFRAPDGPGGERHGPRSGPPGPQRPLPRPPERWIPDGEPGDTGDEFDAGAGQGPPRDAPMRYPAGPRGSGPPSGSGGPPRHVGPPDSRRPVGPPNRGGPPFRGRPPGRGPQRDPRARWPRPAWQGGPVRPPGPPPVPLESLMGPDDELVAGRRPVEEAFTARREARRLLVTPQRRQPLERLVLHATNLRIPIVEVEGGTLTAVAGFDGHQGVALVVAPRRWATTDEILARHRAGRAAVHPHPRLTGRSAERRHTDPQCRGGRRARRDLPDPPPGAAHAGGDQGLGRGRRAPPPVPRR